MFTTIFKSLGSSCRMGPNLQLFPSFYELIKDNLLIENGQSFAVPLAQGQLYCLSLETLTIWTALELSSKISG